MVHLMPADATVAFVAKQIVRLPWSDLSQQCGALVAKLMLKACRKGRYQTIRAVAATAERLRTQRAAAEVPVRLVDSVLEELRWALEYPNFRDQQRVLSYARLLGELYESNQVSGQLIMRQLYDFINIGHEIPEALREASKRLKPSEEGDTENAQYQLPTFSAPSNIRKTIKEDEELVDGELEISTEELPRKHTKPIAVSEHSKWDPRVPSFTDPPNSAYRIKLVCTLLEATAQSLVSRNNISRLRVFLTAFQRYLFTKSMLPAEVEFALLDTFDVIDSRWRHATKSQRPNECESSDNGFPRFSSWLDAHNATLGFEEAEAILQSQRTDRFRVQNDDIMHDEQSSHSDDDEESTITGRDSFTEGNEEENDLATEPDIELDEEEQSARSEVEGDYNEYSDDSEEEEEFDEEAYMRQLEEDAFERELRKVTMAALEKGKSVARKQVADNMPSGSQIIKKKDAAGSTESIADPLSSMALGGKEGITFQLLKKGNKGKVEAKAFFVPKDTNLAMVATKHDDEAARERDAIKQRVLQYEAESANAEFSGGNVYLEQEKLQVIRNRPLSMEDIDRNFGTSGGNLKQLEKAKPVAAPHPSPGAPFRRGGGGRGTGRGRGRSVSSGRTLFR